VGNATKILFNDGDSMQQKLDNGSLIGSADIGFTLDSFFSFHVDMESGHLWLRAEDGEAAPDFSINESGHLIYSLQ
jgi:hypothetical protein